MIRHIVAFDLHSTDPAERAPQIVHMTEVLEALSALDVVEAITVRPDLGAVAGHWPVVLVSEHRTQADLDAYQSHPDHKAAAAIAGQYVANRAIVDYELP